MTLELDPRQRAMLEEMGVKVWWPQAQAAVDVAEMHAEPTPTPAERRTAPVRADAGRAPELAAAPRAAAAAPSRSAPAAPASSVPGPATPTAAAAAAAAPLCITPPQRLYAVEGQPDAGGWLVVVDMPPSAEGLQDGVLAGEAGRLLDQMLRALRLHAGAVPVHAMRLWRTSPGQPGQPGVEGSADFDADFESAVAPLAPRMVLALGPLSAQRLLGQQAPLGRLRGSVHRLPVAGAACAVVASCPPAYLLRNSADKARAWADLCLAAESTEGAS